MESRKNWYIKEFVISSKLENSIGSQDASVTDVSENRTIIRICGKQTYVLLSKFWFPSKIWKEKVLKLLHSSILGTVIPT